MKVLVIGAAGFLGQGLVIPFEEHGHDLRLMDVRPFASRHEVMAGDVSDLATVRKAVAGVDGIVIAHMVPQTSCVTPELPFDSHVKGTANLFFAAHEIGITRVVVVSSTSTITGYKESPWPHDLPPRATGIYGLTKTCMEAIAEQYAREFGMGVAVLRVGYILDGTRMLDKYGHVVKERAAGDTDRRDIGEVARLCLEREDRAFEVFHVMSTRESMQEWGVEYTCRRLNWKPRYDFDRLPLPSAKKQKTSQ